MWGLILSVGSSSDVLRDAAGTESKRIGFRLLIIHTPDDKPRVIGTSRRLSARLPKKAVAMLRKWRSLALYSRGTRESRVYGSSRVDLRSCKR